MDPRSGSHRRVPHCLRCPASRISRSHMLRNPTTIQMACYRLQQLARGIRTETPGSGNSWVCAPQAREFNHNMNSLPSPVHSTM